MKSVAIICLIIAIASTSEVKSSFQLRLESQVKSLKKTGWGRVAVGLM